MWKCKGLVALPDAVGELGALARSSCQLRTSALPEEARSWACRPSARLYLTGCSSLVALPDSIGELKALKELNLTACPNLVFRPAHALRLARHGQAPPREHDPLPAPKSRRPRGESKEDFLDGAHTRGALRRRLEEAVERNRHRRPQKRQGQRAIDLACLECRRAMQRALFFLGRYDVDKTPPLHFSATAAVLGATDYGDEDIKLRPRYALKAMRDPSAVLAELEGRAGLDSKFVVAVVGVRERGRRRG